jgi:hypothetical protein
MIPNLIIENYLDKIKPRYDDEVFSKILQESFDKELTEESAIEFYIKKNNGIKPILKWVDNPIQLRDLYPGEKIKLYSSYFNINWVYFYYTFIDNIKENDVKIKPEYYDVDKNENTYLDSKLVFNIFSNTFGVCEISGIDEESKKQIDYKEIVLIKKPKNISLIDDKLHSIKGPAFTYQDQSLRFYYLEGINIDENIWVKTIKTALNNPISIINDQLKESEKEDLKNYISQIEKVIGYQEEFSINEVLTITNIEKKSKIIKYIGYNFLIDSSNVINERSVTTHKGDLVNYQLFEINLGLEIDKIPSRFVKVVCWSTGKEYVIQVDPRNKQCETAIGAIAWTCLKPDGTHCTEEEYLQLEFQS